MSITVENLIHIYSKDGPFERRALDNVSFTIDDGEFIGIIGHTGSGKSTLIQHLNGLLKPDSGHIYIDGIDITQKGVNMKDIRSKVGIVFQYPEYQLFEETVYKDIAYGPLNLGYSEDKIKEIIFEVINLLGVDAKLLDKSPFELSGGQKRKVAIAGVLAMNPQILILDEPTAGLDPIGREELLSLMKKLHKSGKTIITVSHSMEDIAKIADRVMVLGSGRLALFDTVENVFREKELLKSLGLNVPQISVVMSELKRNGINIDDSIYTVDGAYNAICKYLTQKNTKGEM